LEWLDSFLLSRKRRHLSREQSLAAVPVRNQAIEWDEVDGETGPEALLTVPPPQGKWIPVLRPLLVLPKEPRKVQLDSLGSEVWRLCDGERTVNGICDELCARYRLSHREAMLSLTTYLRQLGKRGLIGFAVPTDDQQEGRAEPSNTQEARESTENKPMSRSGGSRNNGGARGRRR